MAKWQETPSVVLSWVVPVPFHPPLAFTLEVGEASHSCLRNVPGFWLSRWRVSYHKPSHYEGNIPEWAWVRVPWCLCPPCSATQGHVPLPGSYPHGAPTKAPGSGQASRMSQELEMVGHSSLSSLSLSSHKPPGCAVLAYT